MMQSTALVDLSPALYLMLLAALLAVLVSAGLWLRHRNASWSQRLRALTWLTLFLTFDLVLFGAFTRLTDSGLGCPDWPGCYASASPMGAHAPISAAQAAMPTGPVTHQKAWIEMVHRYAASGIGALCLLLAVLSWVWRSELRKTLGLSPWWATATLFWVGLQGAFGALTVTMKLFPVIVTLHLLLGIGLLAMLRVLAARLDNAAISQGQAQEQPAILPDAMRTWVLVAYVMLWLQIALGGWVSTNYAVLACNEFPMCQGQWIPTMNFSEGFALWRPLGLTPAGENIGLPALTAIHVVHRMFAFVVFGLLGALAWKLWRKAGGNPVASRAARWLAALLLWQLITGLSNVVLGWPLVAALAHTGGAAGLVVVLTGLLCQPRTQGMLATMHSDNSIAQPNVPSSLGAAR
jgi:heme a synthase